MNSSPTFFQAQVIRRMVETGKPLVYLGGGFWVTEGTPVNEKGIPAWHTTAHTVKAMDARGWLTRLNKFQDSWKDWRELSPEAPQVSPIETRSPDQ